jgi:hypothetical protein
MVRLFEFKHNFSNFLSCSFTLLCSRKQQVLEIKRGQHILTLDCSLICSRVKAKHDVSVSFFIVCMFEKKKKNALN